MVRKNIVAESLKNMSKMVKKKISEHAVFFGDVYINFCNVFKLNLMIIFSSLDL